MIDATRFNSLATALKDRPSRVPDQPNRSLPLRPLPSTPTRSALIKSPKKSPTATKTNNCPESTSENDEANSRLPMNPAASIGSGESADGSRPVESSRLSSSGQETLGLHFYDPKNRKDDDTREQRKSHENSHSKMSKEFANLEGGSPFRGAEESRSHEVGRKRRRSSAKDKTERDGQISGTAQLDESKDDATIPKRKRSSGEAENTSVSSLSEMESAKSRNTIPKCPEAISIESARRYNKLFPMSFDKRLETSADLPSMPTLDDSYIGSRETKLEQNELKIVEIRSYGESKMPQRHNVSPAVTSSTREDGFVEESVARDPERSVKSFAMPEILDPDKSPLDGKDDGQKKTQRRCREDISNVTIRKENEETIHKTTSERRTSNSSPLEARSLENGARDSTAVVQKSESTVQVNEASVTTEQNKLTLELLKLSKERTELRCRLKHTDDSAHRLRLQQRLNCADKKIENTKKYLNKLTETIKSNKKQRPLRIQVRRDLGQTLDTSETCQPQDAISNCEPIAPLVGHTVPTNMISPAIEGAVSAAPEYQPEPTTGPDLEPSTKSTSEHPISNIAADTRNVGGSFSGSLEREIPKERAMSRVWYPKTINSNEEYSNKHPTPSSYQPDVCRTDDAAGSNINDRTTTNSLNTLGQIVNGLYPLRVSSATPHPTMDQDAAQFNPNRQRHCPYARPPSATATVLVDAMIPTPVSEFVASNHLVDSEVRNDSTSVSVNRARGTKQTAHGNSQGMFSRGNGGANINLSSPLQGHSVVPMPQPMYGQMTAQEYPLLVEANRTQQSTQSSVSQKVVNSSSSPYNTGANATTSQLQFCRDTLTNSQALGSVNASRPTELQNLPKKKRCTRARSYDQITQKIISEQFPTLGNWAAQMTSNSNVVPDNQRPLSANLSPTVPTSLPTMEDTSAFTLPARDSYNTTMPVIDGSYFNALANGVSHWPPEMHPHNQKRAMQGYNNQSSGGVIRTHPGNYMASTAPYPPASMYPPGMSRLIHHYSSPSATRSNHPVQSPIEQSLHERTYQLPTKSAQTYGAISTATHQMQMNSTENLNLLQNSELLPPPYAHVPSSHAPSHQPSYYLFQNVAVPDKPPPSYPGTHGRLPSSDKFSRNDVRKPLGNLQYQKHIPKVYSDGNMQTAGRETQDQHHVDPTYDARDYRINRHIGQYEPCVYPNPSNSWHCTLCGVPGAVFNCDGCEMAFYCSENCQRQHWSTHYSDCSKKMPKLKRVI